MDKNDFLGGIGVILVSIVLLLAGYGRGETSKKEEMLLSYCQSIEYEGFAYLESQPYCYDSDQLLLIEWASE